jgi:hypothetical protein
MLFSAAAMESVTALEAMAEWLDLIVILVVLGFIIGVFVRMGSLFKGDDDEEPEEDEEPEDEPETYLEVKKKPSLIRHDNRFYNEPKNETFNVRQKSSAWMGLIALAVVAAIMLGISYLVISGMK